MQSIIRASVRSLRSLVLAWAFASSAGAWAQFWETPCSEQVNLLELPALYFVVDPTWDHLQRSLFAKGDINGWVEGELSHNKLRFNHLAPGVGLSFDIFSVKAE